MASCAGHTFSRSTYMCKHQAYPFVFHAPNSTKNIDFYFIYFSTHTRELQHNRVRGMSWNEKVYDIIRENIWRTSIHSAHICAAHIESNSLSDVWQWKYRKLSANDTSITFQLQGAKGSCLFISCWNYLHAWMINHSTVKIREKLR